MEFNVIDESNKFKLGNIISVFKIPNYDREFVLFSVSEFDLDESNLHIAYLVKDNEGYDYIEEIDNPKIFKEATEAVKEILKATVK